MIFSAISRPGCASRTADALDSYAAAPDDPYRMIPNPAKKAAAARIRVAEHAVYPGTDLVLRFQVKPHPGRA